MDDTKAVTNELKKIKSDVQVFFYSNNVIIAATGWSIGMATKEMITSLLSEVLLPTLLAMGQLPLFMYMKKILEKQFQKKFLNNALNKVGTVAWVILIWILTIFMTYMILEFFLNRAIVGMKSEVKDQDKSTFTKAGGTQAPNTPSE